MDQIWSSILAFITQFVSGVTSLGVSTDSSGGVAVWAHVGGFLGGLILVGIIRPRNRQPAFAY